MPKPTLLLVLFAALVFDSGQVLSLSGGSEESCANSSSTEDSWLLQLLGGDAGGNSSTLQHSKVAALAQHKSKAASAMDEMDFGVLIFPLSVGFAASVVIGCCWMLAAPAEKGLLPRVTWWPRPPKHVGEDSIPAICSKMLANSRDHPLLVPLTPIKAGGAWTAEVLSCTTHKAVLTARLLHCASVHQAQARGGQQRKVVEVWSPTDDRHPLASIDSLLNIYKQDGSKFGQLLRREHEYLLQDEHGREPRWSMGLDEDGTLCVVWKPKEKQKPEENQKAKVPRELERQKEMDFANMLRKGLHKLGKLEKQEQPSRPAAPPSHRSKGPVIATVVRPEGSNAHQLEVMTMSGVDDVLLLVCLFGVIAFDHAFDL